MAAPVLSFSLTGNGHVDAVDSCRYTIGANQMKLRLFDNSLRLRLTRSEVRAAGAGNTIVDTTTFANGNFEFALQPVRAADAVEASFNGQRITVSAPLQLVAEWADSDRVALAAGGAAQQPRVLVEKDFSCLVPRAGGDDDDTFPHPQSTVD